MEKLQNLKKHLQSIVKIEDKYMEQVLHCFVNKNISRGTILLNQGEVENTFHYINKGCLRTFYITNEGNIKTRHISFENSLIGSLSSFITQEISYEYVEAIEDSNILTIHRKDFFKLMEEVPQWEDFYVKLLEKGYVFQNKKIESFVTLSAKERYEKVLAETPIFIKRLPNIILASYLDITPETLSRIKTK
jgi:CRP-like cAMP-binding protein